MTRQAATEATPPASPRRPSADALFLSAVCVAGGLALILWFPSAWAALVSGPREYWLLGALAVIADLLPFSFSSDRRPPTVYVSVALTFAIVLLWGIGPALVVQAVATTVAASRMRLPPTSALFTAARLLLALVAAGWVVDIVGPTAFGIGYRINRRQFLAIFAPALAWLCVSAGLIGALRYLRSPPGRRLLTMRTTAYEFLAHGALLLLAPIIVTAPTGFAIALFLIPLLGLNHLFRLVRAQTRQLRQEPATGALTASGLVSAAEDLIARDEFAPSGSPSAQRFGLILIRLDRIGPTTDTFGRGPAVRLLAEAARRIRETAGEGALVARLGSDEFVVLVFDPEDGAAVAGLASQIVAALAEPVWIDGLPLLLGPAAGCAEGQVDGERIGAMLRRAALAQAQARSAGDAVHMYRPEAGLDTADRLTLLADLSLALRDPEHVGEITVVYQPQVAVRTGDVLGVEALLRWSHPVRGTVHPEEFVHLAQATALTEILTERIVDEVVAQLAAWKAQGLRLRAAFNVGMQELRNASFPEHIIHALRQWEVPASLLKIEITEGVLMEAGAEPAINRLTATGVAFSLDDFGTGFASLRQLRRLPLSEVKIDKSYVQGMAANSADAAFVRCIIELADTLGISTVAEGVEDAATCDLLARMGDTVAQGWFFAPPMSAAQLTEWATERRQSPPPAY